MDYVVAISGFLGAWLLVGGPIYQASLELKEQQVDREAIDATTHDIPKPPKVSPWWWLLPPVAYILNARRNEKYRQAIFAAMRPEHIKQTVVFLDKARGWLIVACGAFFIAVKETWELIHLLDWHVAVFWALVVVLPIAAVSFTAFSLSRSEKILEKTGEAADA